MSYGKPLLIIGVEKGMKSSCYLGMFYNYISFVSFQFQSAYCMLSCGEYIFKEYFFHTFCILGRNLKWIIRNYFSKPVGL